MSPTSKKFDILDNSDEGSLDGRVLRNQRSVGSSKHFFGLPTGAKDIMYETT